MNILSFSGRSRGLKKVAALATAITISGVAIIVPLVAVGQTTSQSTVDQLTAQIAALQAQIAAMQRGTATAAKTGAKCTFTQDLHVGSRGDDVTCLQNTLIAGGYLNVAATGYFGSKTKAAVVAWQRAAGVSPTSGYFGPKSQAAYNAQVAQTPTTPGTPGTPGTPTTPGTPGTPAATTTPSGSGLSFMLDSNQPVANLAPGGAARVPFTRIRATASADGDITITGLTVERKGPSNDAALDSIVLLDENGAQVGLSKTLNSLHQVLLNEPVVVKAGTTRTLVLAGNMTAANSSYNGQVIQLALVGVNAGTAAVTGVSATAPLVGNGQTYNSTVSIGTVSMQRGSTDPGVAATKNIGQLNYTFSAVRVTAGSAEKVYLKFIRWNQTGSVASGDLANVQTYVDGTGYAAVVSANGKYYTTTFTDNSGQGLLIDKGFSKEISIQGDITGGSGRTVIFDIAKKVDIGLNGQTYGFGILPPQTGTAAADHTNPNFTSSEDPWYAGGTVTVSAGTMSISASNAVAAQNIAVNVNNVPLGAFTADVKGEPITVNKIGFNITVAGGAAAQMNAGNLTNVSLVDQNGNVIAGPVDGNANDTTDTAGAGTGVVVFSTSVTFPVGLNTYTLKGKVSTNLVNNVTIQASTTPSTDFASAKGQNSGNSITPSPAAAISFNTMTVKTGALTVSVATIPVAQTVIAGALQFEFARYIFDTTASGEDVRVSSVPLYFNAVSGNRNDVTNCQLYDGATSLNTSNKKNPATADTASSTSITFDGTGLVLSKGTSKTLSMKCDVRSGSTGVYQWGIQANTTFTGVTGIGSGQTIAQVFVTAAGQQMTASSGGTFSTVLDTNSPGYAIIAAGTSGVELARVKYSAVNEDIDIKQIAFKLTGTASNTPNDLVNNQVNLYDQDTMALVGTAVVNSTGNATSSLLTAGAFRVPKGGAKTLIIKGDIPAISSTGFLTRSGDLLIVDYDGNNNGVNGNYGTGVASGATITPSSSSTASSGVRIMRSYPIVAYIALPTTTIYSQGDNKLYQFSVQAKNGDVAIYKWSFSIGSSSLAATTSLYALYAYTQNSGGTLSSEDTTFQSNPAGLINAGKCFNGLSSTAAGPRTVAIYPDKGSVCNTATTTYIVPNGQTRYFQLRATAANVSTVTTSKDTVTVNLSGDSAYPSIATTMAKAGTQGGAAITASVDGQANNSFIWSPVSTTTQNNIQDIDFTNGYQVQGLPSVGTTQTTLQSQ